MAGARTFGHTLEIPVREQALRKRREHDAAGTFFSEHAEEVRFDPSVQHRVRRLVDEEWGSESLKDRSRLARALRRIRRDAGVKRFALAHRGVESTHGLLQRSVGVEAV